MTDRYNYFQRGSEYPEKKTIDTPREVCCSSCAFGDNPNTVRPADVTIEQLYEHAADFDVFYCHKPLSDGTYRVCANWFKEHGSNLERHAITKQEIDEILNRDTL